MATFDENLYSILGLTSEASPEDVKRAFYQKAKLYAPDKNVDTPNFSDEMMKKLTAAYRHLSDQELRRQYDSKAAEKNFENDTVHEDLPALRSGSRISEKIKESLKNWKSEWTVDMKVDYESDFVIAMESGVLIKSRKSRCYGMLAFEKLHEAFDLPDLTYLDTTNLEDLFKLIDSFYATQTATWIPNSSIPPTVPEGTVQCIYDLEALAKKSRLWKTFQNDFVPGSSVEQLKKYLPQSPVKKCMKNSSPSKCFGCSKQFGVFNRLHPCYHCGNHFCYYCVENIVVPKVGGIRDYQELCKPCIKANKKTDAQLWFTKACELIKSEDSLVPGFRCLLIALHLEPGYDNRLLQFVASPASSNPERAIAITLEILQLTEIPDKLFYSLQLHLANSLIAFCKIPSAENVDALAGRYNLTTLALTSLAEIKCQFATAELEIPTTLDTKEIECNEILLNILRSVSCDKSVFKPFLEIVKQSVLTLTFSNLMSTIEKLPSWQRQVFISTAVIQLENEEFPFTLEDNQKEVFMFLKGIDLILSGTSADDIKEGCRYIETVFWKYWHRYDEIGKTLLQLLHSTMSDGHTLPYENILTSVIVGDGGFMLKSNQLVPPRERLWPELSFSSRNMKPIIQYEKAILKNLYDRQGYWKPIDAALAYWDMLDLCEHPAEYIVSLLNSSLYALEHLRQVLEQGQEKSEIFSIVKLILNCTSTAMMLTYRFTVPPPFKYYVSRITFSVANEAGNLSHFSEAASEAEKYLQTLVFYAPLSPALFPPTVMASEAVMLLLAYNSIYSKFLDNLEDIDEDQLPISEAHLKYFLYERTIRDDSSPSQVENARQVAMQEMMQDRGIATENVKSYIHSQLVNRREGWVVRNSNLLGPIKDGFSKVKGVAINKETHQVRLLVEQPNVLSKIFLNEKPLISWDDISTLFSDDITNIQPLFFSLDQPDDKLSLHPFQTFRYQPRCIKDSSVLNTLFHTDYLLKQFAMGVEISGEEPYPMRPAGDGVLKGLSPTLASALRSVHQRGGLQQRATRMWIQVDKIYYDQQENNNETLYIFDDTVKISVRSHLLLPNAEGKLEDAPDDGDSISNNDNADKQFCRDITEHFAELSSAFPEFARIAELSKINAVLRILAVHRKSLSTAANNYTADNETVQNSRRQYHEQVDNLKSSVRNMLEKLEYEVSKKAREHNIYLDRQQKVDIFVENLTSALPNVSRSRIQDAVSSWQGYSGDMSALVNIFVENKAPSAPPNATEITSQVRQLFSGKLAQFDCSVKDFQEECRRLKGYKLPNSDDKTQDDETNSEWVPAVCFIEKEGNEGRIMYGGVNATGSLEEKRLANYKSGHSVTLNSSTFSNSQLANRVASSASGQSGKLPSSKPKKRSRRNQQKTARMLARDFFGNLEQDMKIAHNYMCKNLKGELQHAINQARKKGSRYIRNPPGYEWAHNADTPSKDGYDYSVAYVRLMPSLDHLLLDKRRDFVKRQGWYKNRSFTSKQDMINQWREERKKLIGMHESKVEKAKEKKRARQEQNRRLHACTI